MKKTVLLTIFIVLLSITTISAAPSTEAGNGGKIVTVKTTHDKTDLTVNDIHKLERLPDENIEIESGYTTTKIIADKDQVREEIVKPGVSSTIVLDKKTEIAVIETTTEYDTYTKTTIYSKSGVTSTYIKRKDGSAIHLVKDENKGTSTSIETDKNGKITTVTTDLETGVSTSISENDDGSIKKVIIVPHDAPAPEGLITTHDTNKTEVSDGKPVTINLKREFTVFLADEFTFKVTKDEEELISSKQKYIELTKIPLALDEKSFEVEDIRSNTITLVPKDNVLDQIDKKLFAGSMNYISKDSYMSDFYELQVYLKEGDKKEVTHEGVEVSIHLPEYVTEDIDVTRSGVVHYEQNENIYEFVLFDDINVEDQTVKFTLRSTSPISYVFRYNSQEEVVSKCYIHWIILLTILIYIIAALLIVNKKKHLKYANLLEALISILLALYTRELWCIVMTIIALLVIVIMTIIIKNANKEDEEEQE